MCAANPLLFRKNLGVEESPPNFKVVCMGGLYCKSVFQSFLPVSMQIFSQSSNVQISLKQFLHFSQRKMRHTQLYIIHIIHIQQLVAIIVMAIVDSQLQLSLNLLSLLQHSSSKRKCFLEVFNSVDNSLFTNSRWRLMVFRTGV